MKLSECQYMCLMHVHYPFFIPITGIFIIRKPQDRFNWKMDYYPVSSFPCFWKLKLTMALCMTHLNSHYGPGVFTKEIQSASVHFSQIGLHARKTIIWSCPLGNSIIVSEPKNGDTT